MEMSLFQQVVMTMLTSSVVMLTLATIIVILKNESE